jgi:hypothetical protein
MHAHRGLFEAGRGGIQMSHIYMFLQCLICLGIGYFSYWLNRADIKTLSPFRKDEIKVFIRRRNNV